MLRGSAGFQRKEVQRLCQWLTRDPRPDLLVLTNALVAGCVPDIKRALRVKVAVTLQGDDVFLDELPPPYQQQALEQIRRVAEHVDAFLVHSRYYAEFMADYLGIDPAKFRLVPLGIDTSDYPPAAAEGAVPADPHERLRVGYLARLAPEKGLHVLVDAFIRLKQLPHMDATELVVAGWLGKRHQPYAETQFAKLQAAGLEGSYRYLGTVDRAQKVQLLAQLHLLSVPTVYREPKGLYVLESLAAGVPVVQPNHGAFPELLAATGGGRLVPPATAGSTGPDPARTAAGSSHAASNGNRRAHGGSRAFQQSRTMAEQTLNVLQAARLLAHRSTARQEPGPTRHQTSPRSNGPIISARSYRSSAAHAAGEQSRLCRIRPTAR